MEYFDFEEASHLRQGEDDFASDCPEANEEDAVANYEALFFDKTFALPTDPATLEASSSAQEKDERSQPTETGVYPLYRAKQPCDYCRDRDLDCFVAQRGVMQNGCTCCISLYRECSFTHAKPPGVFFETLFGITEDAEVRSGGLTGKRVLKSMPGGATIDDLDGKSRKTGARFSREAVRILKNWLAEHTNHPYPTDREKDELKQLTGLKRSQICNWLANARRRGKIRPAVPASPVIGAVDIPRRSQLPDIDVQDLSPLERWKHSPPEHEAASASAIARAVATAPFDPNKNSSRSSLVGSWQGSRQGSRLTSSNDSSFSVFRAPSISSLETGRSSTSDLSFASGFSAKSRGSYASMDRKDRRRRRRAPPPTTKPQPQKSRSARIFQCTFCADTFPAKYDWQRHEKSLHLALEKWTCAPNGGKARVGNTDVCVFCQAVNPTTEHLEDHNFFACQEKTQQERTFYRKDHLRQHLRLLHDAKLDASMESWKSTTSEIRSRCGFCPKVFSTWQQRVDHLAAHFKNGADMAQWEGGWGFDRHVELLVENAMPPYLIAQERSSMDPFIAKNNAGENSQDCSPGNGDMLQQDSNCWRRLERELSSHVQQQLEQGIVPTDEQLQTWSRMIIFGTDDPWNQTSADNTQWLEVFKRDNGLMAPQAPHEIRLEDLPMDPPYAIQGGLKQNRRVDSGGGMWTSGPSMNHMPATTAPMIDPNMELAFDQLDLQNMDFSLAMEDIGPGIPDFQGHGFQQMTEQSGMQDYEMHGQQNQFVGGQNSFGGMGYDQVHDMRWNNGMQ